LDLKSEHFPYHEGLGVFAAFRRAIAFAPEAPALLSNSECLSYCSLDARVAAVARLLQTNGVGAGGFVGIYAQRSVEAIVAQLAVLRIGAAFVPMEPDFAPEQLAYIAQDIALDAILAHADHIGAAQQIATGGPPVLEITRDEVFDDVAADAAEVADLDPACVLYTSGTTGRPKGVIIPQRALASMALVQPEIGMHPGDRALCAKTVACDGALYDIYTALLNGAALAICEVHPPTVAALAQTVENFDVNVLSLYASLLNLLIANRIDVFMNLRLVLSGGDVVSVPHARKLLDSFPDIDFVNVYGPTETCAQSLCRVITQADLEGGSIPIGHVFPLEKILLLDEELQPVAEGQVGQIAIAGIGVALGYHGRPDLTAEKFIPDPRAAFEGNVYLTGDLGRDVGGGVYAFHGRSDRQVKLAGRRVEIDGIESALASWAEVDEVAVVFVPDPSPHLVAFLVPTPLGATVQDLAATLREKTRDMIAADIFPRRVEVMQSLPLTAVAKVDRKALLGMIATNADRTSSTVESIPHVVRDLGDRVAAVWQHVLGCKRPRVQDTFFELGGTSLLLVEAHAMLEKELGQSIDTALFFDYARFDDFVGALATVSQTSRIGSPTVSGESADEDVVAIVGIAARIPGCADLLEYEKLILSGGTAIRMFTAEELTDAYSQEERETAGYRPFRPIIDGVEDFDPRFFGMLPRDAALMDPQVRIFLEICNEALEQAGLDPQRPPGPVGVFAGSSISTYLLENLIDDRAALRRFTTGLQFDYSISSGNINSGVATQAAYRLDLRGPAVHVDTACSTSLVALARAVSALRCGEVDAALAGGVSITFPQRRGYFYTEGGMVSGDGACRPFDAAASGTVFGDGAGVVVLKRLSQAKRDGDTIHAVVLGAGLSNDGSDKMSYTAPSVAGQAAAITAAFKAACTTVDTVGYVECHGTATPLGDPIEIAGLKAGYGTEGQRIALGSVKANIGHADAAAGVMSVIKTVIALKSRTIPPVANFSTLSPRISLEGSRFRVPETAEEWVSEGPRRAGISSFGVGGTNAHILLEEPPEVRSETSRTCSDAPVLLPLSGKTDSAVAAQATALADHLERDGPSLCNVARTLQQGRTAFAHRAAVAASDMRGAIEGLRRIRPRRRADQGPPLGFLFPGQGAQYVGMGAGLYETEQEYRCWIDKGAELLTDKLGTDIRTIVNADRMPEAEAARQLRETRLTQPALLLTEVALGRLWMSRGIEPEFMIGHSVGEFAAAVLSGVMRFEDAVTFIAERGALMQAQPRGMMLSVRAPLEAVRGILPKELDIASENSPQVTVVAGPNEAITAFESTLLEQDIVARRLHTSHAFHSSMMDPVVDELRTLAAGFELQAPDRRIISTVTGQQMTAEQATDPDYWAKQARACVKFHDAILTSTDNEIAPFFVEVGPGRTLVTFAVQSLKKDSLAGTALMLPGHDRKIADGVALAAAAGAMWSAGVALDWERNGAEGRKIPLPGIVFERQRCWIDPPEMRASTSRLVDIPRSAAPMGVASVVRADRLSGEIHAAIASLSGIEIAIEDSGRSFLEFGFDSLSVGQISQSIAKTYGVKIPFRRLLDDLDTITDVAAHIDGLLPVETAPSDAPAMPITAPAGDTLPSFAQLAQKMSQSAARAGASGSMLTVIQAQLDAMQALFAQQLAAIGANVTNAGSITAQNVPGFTPFASETETAVRAGAITDAALQSAPPNCGMVPLTRSQREIWMARQFGDAAECAFIESVSIHLRGALEVQAIEQAWRDLLSRHDALRTRFARDGVTFTTVEDSGDAAILGRRDFSDTQDPQAAFDAFLAEVATTPFDLIEESAVRGTLIATGGDRHVLVISADHIVVDGWSFDVLGAELAELYTAAKECRSADLGEAPSYAAYAATQAGRTDPEVLAYWRETFKIIPERVELPSRQNRPAQRGFDGGTIFHDIPAELLAGVQRVGAANGCTLFQTLFGAMLILVQRLSGAEDLVVGVPTADQMNLPETNAVGHHVNFLPVRALVSADLELKEVLQIGRQAMNAALGHGRITYGALLEELDIPRSVNRLPLTGIEFNFDAGGADLSMPDLEVDMVSNPKQAVAFELFLNVAQHEKGLRIEANYNSGLFDAELVTAWAKTYEKILEAFVQSDTTKVEALQLGQSMLPGAAAPFVALPDKFAQIAADNADRIAVEAGDVQWSYGKLQARAGEIAAYLQKTQPVGGGRIAVCLDRSCGLVAALLGILQAGYSYVPLDPRQPAVRLGQICEEADVQAVICDKAGAAALPDVPAILLDDVPQGAAPQPVEINAQDTAYTIFTSGSTGTPKGVVVPHGALANFLHSMGETPGIGSDDTLLAVTTAMFDIAALELFLPLLNGARVIVATPQEQVDGFALAKMVNDGAITILQATPTLWDMLLVAGLRPRADLRMLCGGEPMPRDLATRLCRDGAALWNMYGPTETTIWSAVKRVDPDGPITIGDPIMATALLILDPNDMPVLPGMTGELNIAGTGLAEGYLNRPDLTEADFREIDVEGMTLRAYRTGDQARFLANGEIEVLGRLDGQIKLRGFRIELGEIETALRGHADVAQAAVALRQHDSNDPFLAAFVVLEEGAVFDASGISSHVAGLLPDYMVPNRVMQVDTLPRTVGGKLDRKALPEMVGSVVASADPVAPSKPRTDTEKMICAIWIDVLGRNDFGPDDQIYTLGIDSLKLFRIAARMLAEGLNLEVKHIFAHPSVAELAAFYDERRKSDSTPGDGTSKNKRLSLSAYRHGAGRGNRHVT